MSGKLKKITPTTGSTIKATVDIYPNIDYPVFCLKHLNKDYHINKCTSAEKVKFIERLYILSQMSWKDIQLAPRHGCGSEKISRSNIKSGIPNHITPEVDFYALRFDGKKAFVGYKSGFIFHVVYLDRVFNLYNH